LNAQPSLTSDDSDLQIGGKMPNVVPVRGLVALTNDAPLIRALQELASADLSVNVVADLRSLTDLLLQSTGDVALIDAAALDTPAAEVVDVISRQLPDLRIMVAGQSADQQQLGSRITDKTVFRFIHKPASTARLKLLLDAAARPVVPAVIASPAAASAPVIRAQKAPGGGVPHKFIAIGAAALVAVILAVWMFWPDAKTPTATPAAQDALASTTIPQVDVAAVLARADTAFTASKFVASDGSSAAELYRAALKAEPANQRALEGYGKAIDQALSRAEQSLLAGKLTDAGNVAAAVGMIAPDNPRLGFLNTQISREQARVNTDASQRQIFEAQQSKIRIALTTMQDRIQRGALVEPGSGNAVGSFREAESISANDPAVRAARESLIAALLTAADNDLATRRTAAARKLVETARTINSNAPGLDVMFRRVEEVARPATPEPANSPPRAEAPEAVAVAEPPASAPSPSTVAAPVAPPSTTTPSPSPASAANAVVSSSKLTLLRRESAAYPQWALDRLISGWVDLEFTVAPNGSVKDVTVVNAEPKNTFNTAAKSALSRYRYEPVMRDGVAVAQRASIRMRFTAKDAQ
jgi:TonB family protein